MNSDIGMSRRLPGLRRAVLAVCLASLGMGAGQMLAQDAASQTPTQQGEAGQPGGRSSTDQMVDRQMQRLTQALTLTSDQQTQIRPILKEQMSQMMGLRQDTETAPADKQQKMTQIRTDAQGKIRALLSSDQQTKYDTLLAQQQQHMGGRRGRGFQGGADGQTPPSQD
jgi:Spy/CpxP family protein refolding chaperone